VKPVARRVERGKEGVELDDLGGRGEEVLMGRLEEEGKPGFVDRGLMADLAIRRVGEM